MSDIDFCPGIRNACAHWREAAMLQQTFAALEKSIAENNDASIDCAKSIVEVFCRVIVDELDSPLDSVRPQERLPDFGAWMGAAVKVLKLGDNRNAGFKKIISQHHKLTAALGELRNDAGPVSHGRDGFLEKLSIHHRRAAVLSADAIVTFLHSAYLESKFDLTRSREPYERFQEYNDLIDSKIPIEVNVEEDGFIGLNVKLSPENTLPLRFEISRVLFQLDRDAYVEALNAAKSLLELHPDSENEEQEQ